MDALTSGDVIGPDDPLSADLDLVIDRHARHCHESSPPESVHMLDRAALVGVDFFSLRRDGRVLAMGALKHLSPDQGELKSMHVLVEYRGQGLSRAMLDHLIDHARALGMSRLWLETGAEPVFAPARALYQRAGFAECPPFGDYRPDPNSVFMTRAI
ncbi:MAG: GNAT family N-acetyltransferase [Paracoccus sp. (in: a-proteobacteria)]|uniref:GNAT family N-acetyltransferase n=1 Tax=Paracoccus sp. TaxID=267 RepID=UPI0026DF3F96|nr:GNAT family N-acetyltransferase [Paracoccus sp. (in: a-proteobacteria)]MDO5621961.1 GNAT family N-acetyltransferase [Paracoccus sp. (in: a-proteobacteria)]